MHKFAPMVRYSEMYSFLFVAKYAKKCKKRKEIIFHKAKTKVINYLMLNTNIFSNMDFINGHAIP